jgi:hypothetical protein
MLAQPADGDRPAAASRIASAIIHRHENEHWSGFRASWRKFVHACRTPWSVRAWRLGRASDDLHRSARADGDFAPHKRTCAENARTPAPSTTPRGRDPGAGNERPATSPPRVPDATRRRIQCSSSSSASA